jgi:hypothetical protein
MKSGRFLQGDTRVAVVQWRPKAAAAGTISAARTAIEYDAKLPYDLPVAFWKRPFGRQNACILPASKLKRSWI